MLAPSSVSRLMSPFQPRPEGGGERKKREGRRVERKYHGGYTRCVPCRLLTREERGREEEERYRIVGNFRGSKFSRKSRFPSRRNFRSFNFRAFSASASFGPRPFIIARLTEAERSPVGDGRTLFAGLK